MPHALGSTLTPLVRLGRTPEACWQWLGVTDEENGYGKKSVGGKTIPAHRWLWMQLFGPVPEGLVISQTCGNRACCNPHHLVCTHQAHANRAGANTTLTPADVLEIKAAKKDRGPGVAAALALRFGVSKQLIFDIWGNRAWARARPNHGPYQRQQSQPLQTAESTT